MDFVTALASREDLPAVLGVWHAANLARSIVPSADRIKRVEQKLEATDAVVLLGRLDDDVTAMALTEPWRADGGTGVVVPGRGHVSMVFVRPEHWGRGLGKALMADLQGTVAACRGWSRTTLWTRESNERAQHLYVTAGYQPTGRVAELPTGERVLEFDGRHNCS